MTTFDIFAGCTNAIGQEGQAVVSRTMEATEGFEPGMQRLTPGPSWGHSGGFVSAGARPTTSGNSWTSRTLLKDVESLTLRGVAVFRDENDEFTDRVVGPPVEIHRPDCGPDDDAQPDTEIFRFSGPDRFATSAQVSRAFWPLGSGVAVVATGSDYPDALAAGPVAARHQAPLLLDGPGLLEELTRLDVEEVIVAGGPTAVSDDTVAEIRQLPSGPTTRRVQGTTRYETAARLAEEAGAPEEVVSIASGVNYPDAVAAGTLLSTPARPPVVLSDPDELPPPAAEALGSLDTRGTNLLGGQAALSQQLERELTRQGLNPTRIGGASRYDTSLLLAQQALRSLSDDGPRALIIATGDGFADALAAGAATATSDAVLLLVPKSGPTPPQEQFLEENRDRFYGAYLIGGPAVLDGNAVDALCIALEEDANSLDTRPCFMQVN